MDTHTSLVLADASSAAASALSLLLGFVLLAGLIVAYFVPTILANRRHTVNVGAVAVINVLLGWTCIGWIVALAMAAGGMTHGQLTGMRTIPAPAPEPTISPDGRWWWDGSQWQPIRIPPAPPPALSEPPP
jgi:hypothetical protein